MSAPDDARASDGPVRENRTAPGRSDNGRPGSAGPSRFHAAPVAWVPHGDRLVAVNQVRPGWAVLNRTAAWLVRHCEQSSDGRTRDQLTAAFRDRFGEAAPEEMDEWLGHLEGSGLLARTVDGARPEFPGLEPPPYDDYRVEHVYFELLARCNLRCVHCFMEGAPEREEILEPDEVARLLEELRAAGGRYVTLAGGEPLIYPAFDDTVRKVAELGFHGTVVSNGTLIKQRHFELLRDCDFNLAISLDGVTPEVNKAIRGKGTAKALAALDRALEVLGPERVILSFTPVKANICDLPRLFEFVEDKGIRRLNLSLYEEVGRAHHYPHLLSLTEEDRVRIMEIVYENALRLIGRVEVDFNDTREILTVFRCDRQPHQLHPLWRGVRLTSSGDVYPSSFGSCGEYHLGNVRERPLAEILRSPVLADLYETLFDRYERTPRCQECVWRHICRGGSVTSAYYATGQLFAPDSYCEGYKKMYPEVLVRLSKMSSASREVELETPAPEGAETATRAEVQDASNAYAAEGH
jgi:radical SAM protein with 4Fe4S-binding SPASM domain